MGTDTEEGGRAGRRLVATLTALLWVVMAWTVLGLPPEGPGLSPVVALALHEAGVAHPVTAVLLDFRGYDTLLEVVVLLLVVIAVCAPGGAQPQWNPAPPGPVLASLIRILVPVAVLVAGHLLWAGAHAPGGAFQAGAMLGAVGVLLLLGDCHPPPQVERPHVRLLLAAGLCVFLAVAAAGVLVAGSLLEYPQGWAGPLIVLVEVVLAVSIGATFTVLYGAGLGRPGGANRG